MPSRSARFFVWSVAMVPVLWDWSFNFTFTVGWFKWAEADTTTLSSLDRVVRAVVFVKVIYISENKNFYDFFFLQLE